MSACCPSPQSICRLACLLLCCPLQRRRRDSSRRTALADATPSWHWWTDGRGARRPLPDAGAPTRESSDARGRAMRPARATQQGADPRGTCDASGGTAMRSCCPRASRSSMRMRNRSWDFQGERRGASFLDEASRGATSSQVDPL
ncbi:hypothetical protein SEVIR_9G472751v4 [Setaria viridis]